MRSRAKALTASTLLNFFGFFLRAMDGSVRASVCGMKAVNVLG